MIEWGSMGFNGVIYGIQIPFERGCFMMFHWNGNMFVSEFKSLVKSATSDLDET